MHAVFLACLIGGAMATVLFAALGGLAGHGAGHLHVGHSHAGSLHTGHVHAGAHGHSGHTTHGHGGHSAPGQTPTIPGRLALAAGWTLSWFNPLTLAAAALCFGGAGLVAENLLPASLLTLALIGAIGGALLGAALVRVFMAALVRASTPPLQREAAGAIGVINAPIRPDASGEVLYTLEGLRRSAPARSVDGRPLPRGTNVVIVRREHGIAWVAPLDPLDALEQPRDSTR